MRRLLTLLAVLLLMVPGKAQSIRKLDMGKAQSTRLVSKRAMPLPTYQGPRKVLTDGLPGNEIITTAPTGERHFYSRSGTAYYLFYDEVQVGELITK